MKIELILKYWKEMTYEIRHHFFTGGLLGGGKCRGKTIR